MKWKGGGFNKSGKRPALIVGIMLIALFAGLAGFFAWKYFDGPNASSASSEEKENADTSGRVLDKVGAIYELPNEEPTVAQIQDKSKLKGQVFFERAENGDYLLVYPQASLALIFRESIGKLINAGPVNIPEEGGAGDVAGEATETKKDQN